MNKLMDGYRRLYLDGATPEGYRFCGRRWKFEELSHFVGSEGKLYARQEIRPLLVGRAVNGWGHLDASSPEAFAQSAEAQLRENHFSWIVCDHGMLRNDARNDGGKYYWLAHSPFWRTFRKIWEGLTGNCTFRDTAQRTWLDTIAWTNLYKLAPRDTGNPTGSMCRRQLAACREILAAEIGIFNPTHILFATGYAGWFEAFQDLFDGKFSVPRQNIPRGQKKNAVFVECCGETESGIRIVVACRPERRNEERYVSDVLQAMGTQGRTTAPGGFREFPTPPESGILWEICVQGKEIQNGIPD